MTVTSPAQSVRLSADPWVASSSDRARRVWTWALVALVVGSSGVLGRLWQLGVNARRAAVVLVVAAVLWELLLRVGGNRRPLQLVGLAGVAVLAELVSGPSGGRAPAVLLLVSVTVADAALVDWRPTASWPRREQPVAGLAVPFLVLAQVAWYRTGLVPVFLGLLTVSMLLVECTHRWPAAVRPVDRALARAVVLLGDAVGALAVLVVALPVYLVGQLGRVVGLGPSSTRRRRGASGWRSSSPSPATDAGVPFSSPSVAVRRRRHLAALGTVLATALVVGGAVAWGRSTGAPAGNNLPSPVPAPAPTTTAPSQLDLLAAVPYSSRPAFDGDQWADDLQRDQEQVQLVPGDGVGWRNAPTTRTRWVNVRDGRRSTVAADCPGCPRATVWLVGASSVYGIGQRDRGTVASYLTRAAAADGVALEVVNLGVPGWTSHQEATDALDRLQRAEVRPDAVVVVDGFNDVTAATAREALGRGDDTSPLVFEEGGVQAALSSKALTPEQIDRVVGRSTSALRTEHGRLADALAAEGVPFLRFFQPDAFASPRQLASVRSLYKVLPGLVERAELGVALNRTAAGLADGTVDLRDTYNAVQEPVMVDVVHTNEAGAAMVADRVIQQLAPVLREQTGRS